jgi:hypothetical protein
MSDASAGFAVGDDLVDRQAPRVRARPKWPAKEAERGSARRVLSVGEDQARGDDDTGVLVERRCSRARTTARSSSAARCSSGTSVTSCISRVGEACWTPPRPMSFRPATSTCSMVGVEKRPISSTAIGAMIRTFVTRCEGIWARSTLSPSAPANALADTCRSRHALHRNARGCTGNAWGFGPRGPTLDAPRAAVGRARARARG